ncbi:MAG: hypothetical protein VXW14_00495 [Candidatus Thermoplasmatota archaeon]|nr:hypothetical protein [Candidatus Thermoplasmatota archaeon]
MEKVDQLLQQFSCPRIVLIHTAKIGSTVDTNLRQLQSFLSSRNKNLEIMVQPLSCSDYPFALGESFSRWITSDVEKNSTQSFDVVISEDLALGYFVGLTSLSLESIQLRCHLLTITNDFTKHDTHLFDPEKTFRIAQLPLFDDINRARDFFRGKSGTSRIFSYVQAWHDEERKRYNEDSWFKSKDIQEYAKRNRQDLTQSLITKHLSIMVDMGESFRVIERNKENQTLYRITSVGRAYSWHKKN